MESGIQIWFLKTQPIIIEICIIFVSVLRQKFHCHLFLILIVIDLPRIHPKSPFQIVPLPLIRLKQESTTRSSRDKNRNENANTSSATNCIRRWSYLQPRTQYIQSSFSGALKTKVLPHLPQYWRSLWAAMKTPAPHFSPGHSRRSRLIFPFSSTCEQKEMCPSLRHFGTILHSLSNI